MKKYYAHILYKCLFVGLLMSSTNVKAQIGGENTYQFLQLPASTYAAALGSYAPAYQTTSSNLSADNIATVNPKVGKQIALHTVAFPADINYGNIQMTYHADSLQTTISGGIRYISYGKFKQTDNVGNITNQESAGDYALRLGATRYYQNLSYGVAFNFISSSIAGYNSNGISADIALRYYQPAQKLGISLQAKNIGSQLKGYYPEAPTETLPFDVQLTISKRLAHVPIGFSLHAHHLNQWNLSYKNTQDQANTMLGEDPESETTFADELARHLAIGSEIFINKSLQLRIGYHHQRNKDLQTVAKKSMAGLSLGAALQIKRIAFQYAYLRYHLAGGAHHFGCRFSLSKL